MTKNNNKQILNKAGNDIAKANNKVLIPRAPLTRRKTLPTLTTRTTRKRVGETRYAAIKSFKRTPKR